jgi:hypothetical protein
MNLESAMREAVELLRNDAVFSKRFPLITIVTDAAVVDGPVDDAGKLPANPDTGAGTESGTLMIKIYDAEAMESSETGEDIPSITFTEEEIVSVLEDKATPEVIAGMIAETLDFETTTDDPDSDVQDEEDSEDD